MERKRVAVGQRRRRPGDGQRTGRTQRDVDGVRKALVRAAPHELGVERGPRPDREEEKREKDAAAERESIAPETDPDERPLPAWTREHGRLLVVLRLGDHRRPEN